MDGKVGSKTEVFAKIVTKDIDSLRQEMYKVFSTKQDVAEAKAELTKTIYVVVLVQFLAIVSSVIAIVSFLKK